MRLDPRDLDRRLVPAAARGLRQLLDAGARLRGRAAVRVRQAAGTASQAAQRADDRATSQGPLRLLRDVPQLALLVVAAVFLSGTAAALLLAEPDPPPGPAVDRAGTLDDVVRLGVPPGTDVEQYLAQTRVVLDDLAEQLPDAPLLAVVHLSRYVPAVSVPDLVAGTTPQRAYLRASTAGPDAEIVSVPLQEQTAATVLTALCTATSARKTEDGRNFTTLADSIEPSSPEEELSKADFQAEAVRATAEAQAYSGECVTAFAVVVEGPAAALRALLDRDGVRGVEPAPAGAELPDVDVQPLLPETTGTVPTGTER